MNRFAALLDRLAYEPSRNNKLALIVDYFREVPDPDRGYALAALTGALSFKHAKAGVIRTLITERADPVLFEMSYDYVGDLSETVALMWPVPARQAQPPLPSRERGRAAARGEGAMSLRANRSNPLVAGDCFVAFAPRNDPSPGSALRASPPSPARGEGFVPDRNGGVTGDAALSLTDVVTTLATLGKAQLPAQLARWLDELDETGRWALLKLVTGALRIGVSARLAKTAVASLGNKDANEIELVWPGLSPPYLDLFAWVEGHAGKPSSENPAPFRPVMLSHAIEETDFASLDAGEFSAEWKWDGIRVQAAAGRGRDGARVSRLYSRTGEDISGSFPDLAEALQFDGAIDGELLILREGRVQSFNVLQQRLNRKTVTPKLLAEFPAHLRAYDLLFEDGHDLRDLPLAERRKRLEALLSRLASPRIDISPQIPFATWDELAQARRDPAVAGAGVDSDAIEGVMIKKNDSPYLPGRPKGPWWKWKRDPFTVDAVLMYAQRGHGKRSSYYSDYTFGVWTRGEGADELVPVGKAYFGFTDAELAEIDRFVRRNTIDRFGPVREVVHDMEKGLVFEVAFEGLQRSTRHKSGLAMRFPRISRLRWDKPPRDADRLETLEAILKKLENAGAPVPAVNQP